MGVRIVLRAVAASSSISVFRRLMTHSIASRPCRKGKTKWSPNDYMTAWAKVQTPEKIIVCRWSFGQIFKHKIWKGKWIYYLVIILQKYNHLLQWRHTFSFLTNILKWFVVNSLTDMYLGVSRTHKTRTGQEHISPCQRWYSWLRPWLPPDNYWGSLPSQRWWLPESIPF